MQHSGSAQCTKPRWSFGRKHCKRMERRWSKGYANGYNLSQFLLHTATLLYQMTTFCVLLQPRSGQGCMQHLPESIWLQRLSQESHMPHSTAIIAGLHARPGVCNMLIMHHSPCLCDCTTAISTAQPVAIMPLIRSKLFADGQNVCTLTPCHLMVILLTAVRKQSLLYVIFV